MSDEFTLDFYQLPTYQESSQINYNQYQQQNQLQKIQTYSLMNSQNQLNTEDEQLENGEATKYIEEEEEDDGQMLKVCFDLTDNQNLLSEHKRVKPHTSNMTRHHNSTTRISTLNNCKNSQNQQNFSNIFNTDDQYEHQQQHSSQIQENEEQQQIVQQLYGNISTTIQNLNENNNNEYLEIEEQQQQQCQQSSKQQQKPLPICISNDSKKIKKEEKKNRVYAKRGQDKNKQKQNIYSGTFIKLLQKLVKYSPLLKQFEWSTRNLKVDKVKKTLIIYDLDSKEVKDLKFQLKEELKSILAENRDLLIKQEERECKKCQERFGIHLCKELKIINKNQEQYEWHYERSLEKFIQILQETDIQEQHFQNLSCVENFRPRPPFIDAYSSKTIRCEYNDKQEVYHYKDIYNSIKLQHQHLQQQKKY